jgi:hypothetical protein
MTYYCTDICRILATILTKPLLLTGTVNNEAWIISLTGLNNNNNNNNNNQTMPLLPHYMHVTSNLSSTEIRTPQCHYMQVLAGKRKLFYNTLC